MLRISKKLTLITIIILALIFYSLSAYGIWSVTLIPDVIKMQLTPIQLDQIYTMYSLCVVLTIALGIVTYLLVEKTRAPAGVKTRRYITHSPTMVILLAIFIILLIACITSYYYLAQVTAPLSP